ncbi:MAG: hypothetical protein JWP44_1864 [Mucilaginibacter sp.]|nr:hypothetical protein [Mucilaginibacter sp.]
MLIVQKDHDFKIIQNTKALRFVGGLRTQSRGRTGTTVKLLVFETNASTDSAIWAFLYERWINSFKSGLQMYLNSL